MGVLNQKPERLFVVDVDLTILDLFAEPQRLMPGARQLLRFLSASGDVHLWSSGSESHCRDVATKFKLEHLITDYHDKPSYPPVEAEALEIIGRRPDLQIDDDSTERVANWPFLWADQVYRLYPDYK